MYLLIGVQRQHFAPQDTAICREDTETLKSQHDSILFFLLRVQWIVVMASQEDRPRRRLHRERQLGVIVVYHSEQRKND